MLLSTEVGLTKFISIARRMIPKLKRSNITARLTSCRVGRLFQMMRKAEFSRRSVLKIPLKTKRASQSLRVRLKFVLICKIFIHWFVGLYCVVVGEFSESKESISAEIEANGGKCLATITKSNPVTHIVLVSMLVLNFNHSFNHPGCWWIYPVWPEGKRGSSECFKSCLPYI